MILFGPGFLKTGLLYEGLRYDQGDCKVLTDKYIRFCGAFAWRSVGIYWFYFGFLQVLSMVYGIYREVFLDRFLIVE